MHLTFGADRLLAVRAAEAAVGPVPRPWFVRARPSTSSPPEPLPGHLGRPIDDEWRRHVERTIQIALVGESDQLCDALTSDAVNWSPTWHFRSRTEAEEGRREHASALTVHEFVVPWVGWVSPVAVAEWSVVAVHDTPLLVADEVLIEATGRTVSLTGAAIAEFDGDRIAVLHSYFDEASLIEQVLTPVGAGNEGC